MRKAFVVTVGTGTRKDVDIARPLTKAVRKSGAGYVALVASAGSEAVALRVARDAGLSKPEEDHEVVLLTAGVEDDLEGVFEAVARLLDRLVDDGFGRDEIELDFTSGTKAMSAGAVLAAVHARIDSLQYISGERHQGVVRDGTERFTSFAPARVQAARDLDRAEEMLRALQFEAARALLGSVPDAVNAEARARRDGLGRLASAYRAWDLFDHAGFDAATKKVDPAAPWAAPYRLGDEGRARVAALAARPGALTEDLVADLANNVERRLGEGRWDDAVARAYRLCEMVAQLGLARRGIDTAKLVADALPEASRAWLRPLEPGKGLAPLGLEGAYRLLGDLGDPLAAAFRADTSLGGSLGQRNASILAHGTKPVGERTASGLVERVVALAATAVPDLAARRADLRFPWQREVHA